MKILSSSAWSDGFEILFWDIRNKISFNVKSKKYLSQQQNRLSILEFLKEIFYWFRWFVIIPLILYCLFLWKENIGRNTVALGALFLFILTLSTAATHLRPMVQSKKARQWHSCEHKVVNLLKQILGKGSARVLTTEDLGDMGKTCLNCTTAIHIFFTLAALLLFIIALMIPIEHYVLKFGLIGYLGFRKCFLILLIFVMSSLLIITLLQYFFFTVKPTEEQLKETVRVGKEFMRKYKAFYKN